MRAWVTTAAESAALANILASQSRAEREAIAVAVSAANDPPPMGYAWAVPR
jgi:hypothetical protein